MIQLEHGADWTRWDSLYVGGPELETPGNDIMESVPLWNHNEEVVLFYSRQSKQLFKEIEDREHRHSPGW